MLGTLLSMTFSTPDIDMVEELYGNALGYKPVTRSDVSADQAAIWGTPAAEGQRQIVLQPESGEDTYLRFVEGGARTDYTPLMAHGWNAAEIIVADLQALNDRIQLTPFKIIGKPKKLDFEFTDVISAMQVLGPSQEVLYLTEIAGEVPGFELPKAKAFVGPLFIAVMGGADMNAMKAFYKEAFDVEASPTIQGTVGVLNNAHGLDPKRKTDVSTVVLPGKTVIEIDEMPTSAVARACADGQLPPGNAMSSFAHDDLDTVGVPFIAPPRAIADAPYHGARAAAVKGAAGELFELVESNAG